MKKRLRRNWGHYWEHPILCQYNKCPEEEHPIQDQSRWAWRSKPTPMRLLGDPDEGETDLRSAVDVLLAYQGGRCFYCSRVLERCAHSQDHAFPYADHVLSVFFLSVILRREFPFDADTDPMAFLFKHPHLRGAVPRGMWNLVVACRRCRSRKGLSPAAPDYFQSLVKRNMIYVGEYHPMRDSILLSLNVTTKQQVPVRMKQLYQHLNRNEGWTLQHA